MMNYVALPVDGERQLSFYLAMEEYVARHVLEASDNSDLFFMWQVPPSVIFGRNQQLAAEVNVSYCREHDIRMFRRKSGGGCVYADRDNLMWSYVTKETNVNLAFHTFVNMVILVLRKLGVPAVSTTHNDIMIGDRKVCGTAFYQLPKSSIVHSTMLYDTNMEHMLHAITPSAEKLQAKGIQSVRQRITLLKDYIPQSLEQFKSFVRETLCNGELMLSASDVAAIEALEQTYLREEFIKRM